MPSTIYPIKKILIANRSEIALRIIKTAHKMHIQCVAIYSNEDAYSPHVHAGDEAYPLMADTAKESYLNIPKIIEIAKKSHCDAIHPGYGFLAENADFASACENHGIIFIGPKAKAISLMGNKAQAKAFAKANDIPVIPGEENLIQNLKVFKKSAQKIGFPLLFKASAGGGGKGMKLVQNKDEVEMAFNSARREAMASFGDDTLLIEKYFDHARHIEIQVLADQHGNCVHLFDRDCSLQRRHQKVIEEAPAFGLSEVCRSAMQESAMKLCKAIHYQGAGTLEFLVDADENFYLMEMNTRLQVEHAVSEQITDIDLVEQQILVAQNIPLQLKQKDIQINGHSVEARIYAEQCKNNFLPASGKIEALKIPKESSSVRIDHALTEQQEISSLYDPMIAKVACWGKDRNSAIENLEQALQGFQMIGPESNRDFLWQCIRHPDFIHNKTSTRFIESNVDQLNIKNEINYLQLSHIASLLFNQGQKRLSLITAKKLKQEYSPWFSADNWRINHNPDQAYSISINDQHFKNIDSNTNSEFSIELTHHTEMQNGIYISGFTCRSSQTHDNVSGLLKLQTNNPTCLGKLSISCNLGDFDFIFNNEASGKSKVFIGQQSNQYQAPLNGRIIAVNFKAGDSVKKGQEVLVIEAMKMEHILKARVDGEIDKIKVSKDQQVVADQLLFTFKVEEPK